MRCAVQRHAGCCECQNPCQTRTCNSLVARCALHLPALLQQQTRPTGPRSGVEMRWDRSHLGSCSGRAGGLHGPAAASSPRRRQGHTQQQPHILTGWWTGWVQQTLQLGERCAPATVRACVGPAAAAAVVCRTKQTARRASWRNEPALPAPSAPPHQASTQCVERMQRACSRARSPVASMAAGVDARRGSGGCGISPKHPLAGPESANRARMWTCQRPSEVQGSARRRQPSTARGRRARGRAPGRVRAAEALHRSVCVGLGRPDPAGRRFEGWIKRGYHAQQAAQQRALNNHLPPPPLPTPSQACKALHRPAAPQSSCRSSRSPRQRHTPHQPPGAVARRRRSPRSLRPALAAMLEQEQHAAGLRAGGTSVPAVNNRAARASAAASPPLAQPSALVSGSGLAADGRCSPHSSGRPYQQLPPVAAALPQDEVGCSTRSRTALLRQRRIGAALLQP